MRVKCAHHAEADAHCPQDMMTLIGASIEQKNAGALNDHAVSPTATSRRLLSLMIFSGLLLLIILVPVPYGTVEPWWEAVFECSVFALAALWLIDGLRSGRLLVRDHWVLLAPLLTLVVYAFLQTIPLLEQSTPLGPSRRPISFDPYETRLVVTKLLALILVLALLLRYTDSARRLRALVYSVIGIALASAIFGLVRQAGQHGAAGFLLPALRPDSGYAQFINKNHFAFLAEMALGLLAGLIVGGVPRQRRLVYLALALPLWTALVLSNSRGGILAMLCQVVFLGLAHNVGAPRRDSKAIAHDQARSRVFAIALRFALGVALILIIVIGMIWVGGDPLAQRLGTMREELASQPIDPSHSGRADIWRATLRLCRDHPIAGVGFGGYWIAITRYHQGTGELVPQQAHNDYLELWASGGLIGVALAFWFMFGVLKRARRGLSDPEPLTSAIALGALTGLFGVAVHSLVDFGLHLTGNAIIFVALVALATNQVGTRSSQTSRY
jgi:putative inorganic carbon (HCO3(-)) transporter